MKVQLSYDCTKRYQIQVANARQLVVTANGSLPTVLAQHLFTSFMWTVAKKLPKDCLRQGSQPKQQDVIIEGLNVFNPYNFDRTWLQPKLRHRKLTEIVSKMESYSLGSEKEILLCMVPALSSAAVLPNDAILQLVPPADLNQGFIQRALCFKQLLKKKVSKDPKEKWIITLVVSILDFLYWSHEKFDGFAKLPPDLKNELGLIIDILFKSQKLVTFVNRIVPVFYLQCRQKAFEKIFRSFGIADEANPCLSDAPKSLDTEFAQENLDFSSQHRLVIKWLQTVKPDEGESNLHAIESDEAGY